MNSRGPRRVAFVIYDGIQSLDLTGPLEVFAMANWQHQLDHPGAPPPYTTQVLARQAGVVTASSGLSVVAPRSYASCRDKLDTLIIAGGDVGDAVGDRHLLSWIRGAAPRVRRLASVCSGAFILAQAGLLDGRRATTHWSATAVLAGYPKITVEPDAIFVRDGHIYTSAGVTAGIDLALALVEEDLGHTTALAVARRLVVFLKRPGGQSQFSGHLAAQTQLTGLLKGLPEWLVDHLDADLTIEQLAARAAMSPRNFARVFTREMGVTPAKFVERARLDAARRLLEESTLGLDEIATRCGFTSGEQMRRTFHRHLKIIPHDYRKRFQTQGKGGARELSPATLNTLFTGGKTHGRATNKEARRRPVPGLRAARRIRAA